MINTANWVRLLSLQAPPVRDLHLESMTSATQLKMDRTIPSAVNHASGIPDPKPSLRLDDGALNVRSRHLVEDRHILQSMRMAESPEFRVRTVVAGQNGVKYKQEFWTLGRRGGEISRRDLLILLVGFYPALATVALAGSYGLRTFRVQGH